jgi:deoxyribonuclease-4
MKITYGLKLYFGPAGVPHAAKKKDTLTGIRTVKELSLNAMEFEFVYGVKMNEEQATQAKTLSRELEIVLTAHAPYYINLNSSEESKLRNSINFIVQSAKALYYAGGYSVCFHPGWYQKISKEEAFQRVKQALKKVISIIKDEGYEVWIRPETMEGKTKFGDLDEIIKLCEGMDYALPCIDFAHLRYRNGWNSREEYENVLNKLEDSFGKEILKNMHIHISGIKLDRAGTHVNLNEADLKWKDLIEIIKAYDVYGVIISESPNLEEDALLMMNYYNSL